MNTRLTVPMNNQESTVLGLKPFIHIDTLIKSVLPAANRMIICRGETVHYYKDDVRQCFYFSRVAWRFIVAVTVLF
jgi:hypothetical protein